MNDAEDSRLRVALMVHGEQLLLLRDVFAANRVDVLLYDTSISALLEDEWKPWARRMRAHTKHISGNLFLCAPPCIFPDPQQHSTIRQSLATQIQAVCDAAVTLNAHGVFLPIEAATSVFASRIRHYLAPLHARMTAQSMQLIIHAGMGSEMQALRDMTSELDPPIQLSGSKDESGDYCWWQDTSDAAPVVPAILGPFAEVNHYRIALQQLHAEDTPQADHEEDSESQDSVPPNDS